MQRLGWFVFGAFSAAAVALTGVGIFASGSHGFSANQAPGGVETWFARKVRSAAVPADARARPNPVANSPDVQKEARAHWADHCAVCHGNDGSGDALMGKRTYPPAPDMRLAETQQMTDGELFYVIQNGIRFSAMPAWGTAGADHDEQDSWKLVLFIRHLPNLTLEEKQEMQKLNPKGPDDIQEEKEEEEFLKGETNEPKTQHHHH